MRGRNIPPARIAAGVLTAIFAALVTFQLLLAAGAPLGGAAWGGQNEVLPQELRVSSLISAAIFALAIVVVLEKVGLIRVIRSRRMVTGLMWALVIVLALSALANAASASPIERWFLFPLALVSSILCAVVARYKG